MQQIERTRMLSEELQKLVKASAEGRDWTTTEESEAVSTALRSIFMSKKRLQLDENARPREDVYLQMLECPPECRADAIAQEPDEARRRKLEIACGDLIRLTGAEDYHLTGRADPFDFSWAVPLVQQKKNKKGEDGGGVKVEKLKTRQQLLDLCLRIRPALSLDQANQFLTHIMRAMPIRHRSPIDSIYYFILISGEALGDLDEQRAFVRQMLGRMAQHYQRADKDGSAEQQAEVKRQEKEKKELAKQRMRAELEEARMRDKQEADHLKAQMAQGFTAYQNGNMRRREWMALKQEIEQKQAALKQAQQNRGTLKQLEQQYAAEERARQRMIETATISNQFAAITPGDKEDFMLCYSKELAQMDLLDNHYAARRHLRENLEAVGVLDDRLIAGRRKTAGKSELYEVRLSGASIASANVVEEMLLPAWQSIGRDFLVMHGGVLPDDFPDRAPLCARFEASLQEEVEARQAPSRETVRMELQANPQYYGPFFYRALRKCYEKADPNDHLRRRIDTLISAQKRFCALMENEDILQFIASDYDYECIVGGNKKSWPKQEPSREKSSRLEKITGKASKAFSLNRNDVDDVPRSLLLLTELARIDRHLSVNPALHISATLVRCGYPGLYARRRLDQFVIAVLSFLSLRREQCGDADGMQEISESILSGLREFLKLWLMEPVYRLDRQLHVEKLSCEHPEEIRENPKRSRSERR